MAVSETVIKKELNEFGILLVQCRSSSFHDLLSLLERLERLLIKVQQAPPKRVRDAILPVMKALISSALLRHSNAGVRVALAVCYSEITRITAPDAPYSDEPMKEMFKLIVEAFQHLSHRSSPYYTKAVSILNTASALRSCLVMLDLGLDQLVLEMFQQFLTIVRSNHSPDILSPMETMMTLVIDESEEISLAILTPLLSSTRKNNQTVSPYAWKLGEKVMTNCAAKLKPRLKQVVQSLGIALDDYAPVVAEICQDSSLPLHHNRLVKCSDAHDDCTNSVPANHGGSVQQQCRSNDEQVSNLETCLPRKRSRKPNSLMKPEEGYYDHYQTEWETTTTVIGERRPRGRPRKNGTTERRPRGRPRKNEATTISTLETNQKRKSPPQEKATTEGSDGLLDELVGKRIRVWWPQDRVFYEGKVDSYDPSRQRYKVVYADGDEESLNLRKERWELLERDEDAGDTVKEAP